MSNNKNEFEKVGSQIDKLQDKMNSINEEVVEVVKEVELTDEQKEKLEKIKEYSGVEIDNASEYEIIQSLVDKFKPREIAKPLQDLAGNSDAFIIDNLKMYVKEQYRDYIEENKEIILKSVYDTLENVKNQFKIKEFTENNFNSLYTSSKISELIDPMLYKWITSKRTSVMMKKLTRPELEILFHVLMLAESKVSIDNYIEESARSIELFALKDEKIKELYKQVEKETVNKEIIDRLIEALKTDVDIDNMSEYGIYSDYIKKSTVLKAIGNICINYVDEDEYLTLEIRKMGDKFLSQADTFDYILEFKYLEPFASYVKHVLKSDKLKNDSKQATIILQKFIKRLREYPFKVPVPVFPDENADDVKTGRDYLKACNSYYDRLFETFKDLNLTSEGGNKDLSGAMIIMLARYDKKFLEHENLENEPEKVFRIYMIMETLGKLHLDVHYTRELIKRLNDMMNQ